MRGCGSYPGSTLPRAGYKMEDYDAIFKGDYSRLPQKQSCVVRIFLSSTFGGSNIIIHLRVKICTSNH